MIAESDLLMDSKYSVMNHRKKPKSYLHAPWWRKPRAVRSSKLLSFMDNNLVQFLFGLFIIALLTQAADNLDHLHFKLVVKTIGYGIFFYLGTPFILHWLADVSSVQLTSIKLSITILVVGVYSYVFWDSYFSYKQMLGELLFSVSQM
ncbi:conserved membrane hypothetical protein [Hyella patelloides LEGE 07179]|uniref:Uncharacterized protein n=2 Tax=Hyella TaxID=945733 RepID=A0A563VWW6_9CYAN|nr:conserved membrane hypothetical protein [Hyella patelloides LEGE 07179]